MIEIEISKTRSRSILSDKVSKGLFRAVFSNFHDYLDLFVHKLYASQGRQSHPYKCHRGRRKKVKGGTYEVKSVKREGRRLLAAWWQKRGRKWFHLAPSLV